MSVPPPINVVTSDPEERSMAALAHASIFLNFFIPGLGIIAAAAVWLIQRERSAYAAFHGLQAAVFQLLLALLPIVFGSGAAMVAFAAVMRSRVSNGELFLVVALPLIIIGALLIAVILIFGLLYGLVGAYETYQGRDFRYWLVGNLVTRK
jgi:uncharacterized Tic20 family protein